MVQCGGRQGSGYLLTPRLVLTAAHLVESGGVIRVTVPGQHGEVRCLRAGMWRREQSGIDVALVSAPTPLVDPYDFFGGGARTRWARISSLEPIPGCQAISFPYVQRDRANRLDTEQLTGTYKPGSGLFSGRDVLAIDGTPPATSADGVSPWAGMSGAAVFTGGVLLGVINAEAQGWQHGRVTVTPLHRLLGDHDFLAVLDDGDYKVFSRLTDPSGQPTDRMADFELRYGAYLAKRHSTLRIFGLDLTDRKRATWPLDAAYYSLEAAPTAPRDTRLPFTLPGVPAPAEEALAGHERVLLRGVAGSGKTTLVQWLAVATARQELGDHLHHLRDLVPYVLPLRTIGRRDRLPAPAAFLSAVDAPLTAPAGWAEGVLRDGRALVLIDGLDEVDERARERVGDWLRDLLAAYPGNHWLVTSRPSAVADSWLADEGFAELTLAPMSRADVRAFVERWHNAARTSFTDDPEELSRLDGHQRTLLAALDTKQDLARLATNPLMCALICALHRDRNGYLPIARKELYDAALSMLLIRRDRERSLVPELSEGPQVQLLQKLAYWLVRNGQAEMERSDAIDLVTASLPSMPTVATLGDGSVVYRHLLERSGLLREPVFGSVDFIHRTFQDYLAARAAVEELDFDLLANNAHHDQWSDVIRMAVAHARPAERARLLRKIIDRGDQEPEHSARLHLLAMACLEHATELDPQVRAAVEERAGALIPPRTDEDSEALAAVGPMVLELLPGPEGLSEDEIGAVVWTARLIGGDPAIPLLARYAESGSPAAYIRLSSFPRTVDPELYATRVIRRLPSPNTSVIAMSAEQVAALARLGTVQNLILTSAELFEGVDLAAAFPKLRWLTIASRDSLPLDLAQLTTLPDLTKIVVSGPVRNAELLPHVKVVSDLQPPPPTP